MSVAGRELDGGRWAIRKENLLDFYMEEACVKFLH
jgi:hypothetical protein